VRSPRDSAAHRGANPAALAGAVRAGHSRLRERCRHVREELPAEQRRPQSFT